MLLLFGEITEAEGLSAADNDSNRAPVKWKWLERQRRLQERQAEQEAESGCEQRAREGRPSGGGRELTSRGGLYAGITRCFPRGMTPLDHILSQ